MLIYLIALAFLCRSVTAFEQGSDIRTIWFEQAAEVVE